MLFATEYEILRDVPVSERASTPLARRPMRVATIIDEQLFKELGGALIHNKTVFLEDHLHDWRWRDGKFVYYTRVKAGKADVIVAYAVENRSR